MFSDLYFLYPKFHVGRVAFDGTNYYIFITETVSAFFERPLRLYLSAKTPEKHFRNRKRRCFIVTTQKVFKILENADTVLSFSYLAIKSPNFKTVGEKLPELESRVSHSFDIILISRKKAFKSFGGPSSPLPVKFFCFKISFCI